MNKHDLAEQLRARQRATQAENEARMRRELGATEQDIIIFRKQLSDSTDDDMIDSYITCSHCGKKHVNDEKTLMYIIEHSKDSDDFLDKTQEYADKMELLEGEQKEI
jgi:hypothetical protein